VLGGIPIVVPDPIAYVAGYRDAILASLVSAGRADRASVRLVDEIAESAPAVEPLGFGDDWAAGENPEPPTPAGGGPHAERFAAFLAATAGHDPDSLLLELIGDKLGTVVEVGCGAGRLTARLRRKAARVVAADLSLRAVLRASAGRGEVAGVVLDAEALPLRAGKIDALIAASLVDLLDRPEDFFVSLAASLSRRGRAAISTPDPALGHELDFALGGYAEQAGLREIARHDGVPWIRPHDRRYFQVYFAQVLLLGRA
jgi:SAM-dependent methyltransferase